MYHTYVYASVGISAQAVVYHAVLETWQALAMTRAIVLHFALLLQSLLQFSVCVVPFDDQVRLTPSPPQFQNFFEKLPALHRKPVIASPCVGIHGCGHAFQRMGVSGIWTNVFDLDARYERTLRNMLLSEGMQAEDILLHLGRKFGDILQFPLEKLQMPVDILISGPPCPPWAKQGRFAQCKDDRAHVFVRVLGWLIYFIQCGGLLACCIENVTGILQARSIQIPTRQFSCRVHRHWVIIPQEATHKSKRTTISIRQGKADHEEKAVRATAKVRRRQIMFSLLFIGMGSLTLPGPVSGALAAMGRHLRNRFHCLRTTL